MSVIKMNLTGLIIEGYEFVELLGEGGTAVVWLCRKRFGLGTPMECVLKLFPAVETPFRSCDVAQDTHAREFETMTKAGGHSSLAPILRPAGAVFFKLFVNEDGKIRMEPFKGYLPAKIYGIEYPRADGSLKDAFNHEYEKGVDISLILDDMIQAARGLQIMHDSGLLHRDLKLENLLKFCDDRRRDIRVSDPHHGGGTPPYMAPELFRGVDASPASDSYALGVTIFRACTGSYPIQPAPSGTAHSVSEWNTAHHQQPRPAACLVNPRVPLELSKLIIALLDVDPRNRPTAAEAQAVLERLRASSLDSPSFSPSCLEHLQHSLTLGTNLFNPSFLIQDLGLTPVLFFIRWKACFSENAQTLFRKIVQRSGRNLRFVQVSGETDIVARTFIPEQAIAALADSIGKLTNEFDTVQVFVARHVDPIGRNVRFEPHSDAEVREILWDIECLQDPANNHQVRSEAADRLKQCGVIMPGAPIAHTPTSEIAFSSFHLNGKARTGFQNGIRRPSDPYSALLNAFREDGSFNDWGVTLYEKAPHKVGPELEWPDDLIVEYVMPAPSELPRMLQFLQSVRGRFPDQTLRESHEYLVDCNEMETGRCPADVMHRS